MTRQLHVTPDDDIQIHKEGTIKWLCKDFQNHEAGIPEWLKNSSDVYEREAVPSSDRIVLLVFDDGARGSSPSIACFDFVGMTSDVIETDFRHWGSPDAAGGSEEDQVQGGHGNGGKCYMTQMFDNGSYLYTVKNGIGCRYGVEKGSFRFGYIPDRESGRDVPVSNIDEEITDCLKSLRVKTSNLPLDIQKVVREAKGFTLVLGSGPKGYKKIPTGRLIKNLVAQPQMIMTLELCRVLIVVNGKPLGDGQPLTIPDIACKPGEADRTIPIPVALVDPDTGEEVSTTSDGSVPPGTLVLKTSLARMNSPKLKYRHSVIYRIKDGYDGFVPVSELDVQSTYRDFIYGECILPAIEPYVSNDRGRPVNCPLRRAVEIFARDQIQALAREFEARDKREYDRNAKDEMSQMNLALDKWKNKLLNKLLKGMWTSGDGEGAGGGDRRRLPSGKVTRIEVSLSHGLAGRGVTFGPTVKFYGEKGQQVRPVGIRWNNDDNNVAFIDEHLRTISTFAYGQTTFFAETDDGKVKSRPISLEVVKIKDIAITPESIELTVGSKARLAAICTLDDGRCTDDVYLEWTENNDQIARVSAAGMVYGFQIGETEVQAEDEECRSRESAAIKIVEGSGSGDQGKGKGRGYPQVLLSSIDPDPSTGEPRILGPEEPPVYQSAEDAEMNIWWINTSAPLAKMYYDSYGRDSTEFRMYMLERHIEILAQILLIAEEQTDMAPGEWIYLWGDKTADVQKQAAMDLQMFISNGSLPGE